MQRQAVGVMRSEAVVSERRACGLVKAHRAACRYRRRRVEDPRLRERLRELAATGIDHALVSPRRAWDEATFEAVAAILPEVHAIEPERD